MTYICTRQRLIYPHTHASIHSYMFIFLSIFISELTFIFMFASIFMLYKHKYKYKRTVLFLLKLKQQLIIANNIHKHKETDNVSNKFRIISLFNWETSSLVSMRRKRASAGRTLSSPTLPPPSPLCYHNYRQRHGYHHCYSLVQILLSRGRIIVLNCQHYLWLLLSLL